MENKYSRAKIYKIVCNVTGLVYIGSTCEPTLARRLAGHRRKYKAYLNEKYSYVTSFKVLEHNDFYIELVKECPCNSKDQLFQFEGGCIREIECVNKNIPGRTHKQYYEDNKDKLIAGMKQYRDDNKVKIATNAKQYRDDNKVKIVADNKKYYDENKAKKAIKFYCICGGKYTASHKTRHIKTERHKKYLNDA